MEASTRWLSSTVLFVCAFYWYVVVASAVLVVALPLATGWKPTLVVSGSMEPAIQVGDLVLYDTGGTDGLDAGDIVTFQNPVRPGELLTHRIVGVTAEGAYQTRGDANRVADSTPVPPEAIVGVGRALLPAAGFPLLWVKTGAWVRLALWVVATTAAFLHVRPRGASFDATGPDGGSAAGAPPDPGRRRPVEARSPRARSPLLRVPAWSFAVGSVMALVSVSSSAFSEVSGNENNSFTAASSFGCTAGDTGFASPSAEVADTGGDNDGFEVSTSLAFADGGGSAENQNGPGDRHRFSGYGLIVPAACTIDGIEVRLDWWVNSTAGTNSMDVELSWDGGASWTAAQTDATETTVEHTFVLGGPADTWGRTWSISEIADANFRVRLTSNGSSPSRDFFLDWVPVKITYAP